MIKRVDENNAIIAYKAFDSEFCCRNFQYKVGGTYFIEGEIELCHNGFHACSKLSDVFEFYPILDSHIAIVKLWGDVEYALDKKKLCASCIKIVKELSLKEMITLAIRMSEKDSSLTNEYDECKDKSFASDKDGEKCHHTLIVL